VGVGLDFPFRAERFEASIGLGGALVVADMRGYADEPFRGTDDSVFVPAPVLRSGLVWHGSELLGLRADLLGGVCVPRVAVRFDGRETHYWGRPFALLSLGVELGLF
jgi:hypothetical protein